MTQTTVDVQVSKHSPEYKACVQRVVDTLQRRNGRLFRASERELQAIADAVPYGFHWFEMVAVGMKRYMELYGKKPVRDSKKA
jgi:hypothetical protein